MRQGLLFEAFVSLGLDLFREESDVRRALRVRIIRSESRGPGDQSAYTTNS